MGLKEDLEAAKNAQTEPVLVPVSIGGVLYQVEATRLPGTAWDGIVARCPARAEQHFHVGYDTGRATALALKEHGRLLTADGADAGETDWDAVLDTISGVELRAISAAWWGLNEQDPDQMVIALKKALAGGASSGSS